MFAFSKVIASNAHNFCYLFMIIAMIKAAGLLTLIYPLAVFGYALLEETRPGKKFWNFVLIYTMIVLGLKFAL